jgi:lipoate-protein ligase A
MSPNETALVLGSAQPEETASSALADVTAVVRRRSGGGAVLVVPDHSVWIDVVIGHSDPLWDGDVNRAPLWLGEVWAAALATLGVRHGEVFDRYEPGPWGRIACFASRGPGEVLVGGAKAVGVTQRRTRTTARFQTLLYRRWNPGELFARLAESSDQLRSALLSAAWPVDARPDEIHSAFIASLPR